MREPRVWPVALASVIGVIILCALGFWQVQRLHQKEALLAAMDARQQTAPMSLTEALEASARDEDIEFRHVRTRARLLPEPEFRFIAVYEGGPAWVVVSPALSEDGIFVLVNRGVVPEQQRTDTALRRPSADLIDLEGIVRQHREGRGIFTPDNDAAGNFWHWWDIPAMLGASKAPPDAKVAPFVLQLLPGGGEAGFPRPLPPQINISNNHLQYAITWFSLALVLAVIAIVFVRGVLRRTGA